MIRALATSLSVLVRAHAVRLTALRSAVVGDRGVVVARGVLPDGVPGDEHRPRRAADGHREPAPGQRCDARAGVALNPELRAGDGVKADRGEVPGADAGDVHGLA